MQNNKSGFCIKCDRWVIKGEGTEKENKNGVKVIYCRECGTSGKRKVDKNYSRCV
jgi:RNase P subunit RPR2